MERVYLDSNVFIAFIKREMGKPFRPMYQEVDVFWLTARKKFVLVLSDLFFVECEKQTRYTQNEIIEFFSEIRVAVETVQTSHGDIAVSAELEQAGIHRPDSVHGAMALRVQCWAIVTFNVVDFRPLEKNIRVCEPLELVD